MQYSSKIENKNTKTNNFLFEDLKSKFATLTYIL